MKTRKMTVEGHSASTKQVTPPAKKLKQARLPFQVLSASPTDSPPTPLCKSAKKKRKLSEGVDEIKAAKVRRLSGSKKKELKENKKAARGTVKSPSVCLSKATKKCDAEVGDKNENSCEVICITDSEHESSIAGSPHKSSNLSTNDNKIPKRKERRKVGSGKKQNNSKKVNKLKKITPIAKKVVVYNDVKINLKNSGNKRISEKTTQVDKISPENTTQVDKMSPENTQQMNKIASETTPVASRTPENTLSNNITGKSSFLKVYSAAVSGKLTQDDDIIISSDDSESDSVESEEETLKSCKSPGRNSVAELETKVSELVEDSKLNQTEALKSEEQTSKSCKPAGKNSCVQPETIVLGSDEKLESNECLGNGSKVERKIEALENGERTPKSHKCLENTAVSDIEILNCGNETSGSLRYSAKDSDLEHSVPTSETPQKTPSKTTPSPEAAKARKLTPRQLKKQLDSAKKKEEKELQKQEREKKRTEEREEKERLKQQKKEQLRKEKEEKEEQKKKEKEEKERKKQAELEQKNEERKIKEEEKKAKEEERKAKEEERRKREEQKLLEKRLKEQAEEELKRKKEKEAAAFTSFFVPKKSEPKQDEQQQNTRRSFRPFMVKNDMRLANVSRVNLSSDTKRNLECAIREQSCAELYLQELKIGKISARHDTQTWPLKDLQDEVMIIDDVMDGMDRDNLVMESHPPVNIPHPKLLQFHENRRPPYWGTWTKKTTCIGPRRPFGKEEKLFDYDVDSDDEWEEEEPGESLNGSEDEKESEDEYEVDNDFFVPHGYLSEEENFGEEEEVQSPETMKAKLKLLAIEFEEERNQKTQRLKPGLIGCIWTRGTTSSTKAGEQMTQLLAAWRAVYRSDGPIVLSAPEEESSPRSPNSEAKSMSSQSVKRHKRVKFPETALPDLVKLIHGNKNGQTFLLREFLAHWLKQCSSERNKDNCDQEGMADSIPVLSKKSILCRIKEIATWQQCPEDGTMLGQMCWYVSSEIRSNLGLSDLQVPNSWEYHLKPRRTLECENVNSPATSCAATAELNHKTCPSSGPLITKFTKVLSDQERQKQLSPKASISESNHTAKTKRKIIFPATDQSSKLQSARKKVALTSVPNPHSLEKYLKSPKHFTALKKFSSARSNLQEEENDDNVECVVID